MIKIAATVYQARKRTDRPYRYLQGEVRVPHAGRQRFVDHSIPYVPDSRGKASLKANVDLNVKVSRVEVGVRSDASLPADQLK